MKFITKSPYFETNNGDKILYNLMIFFNLSYITISQKN